MTLKTLFAIPIAVILLVTLSLSGTMAAQGWAAYQRGEVAIRAVERMRLLVLLQSDLWAERVATNAALGQPWPVPETAARNVAAARHEADRTVKGLIAHLRARAGESAMPEPYLRELTGKLSLSRGVVDRLLARDRTERTFNELSSVQPQMLAASLVLEEPLAYVSQEVVAADATLSGLLTVARLSALLRERVSRIVGVLLSRFNSGQLLTAGDVEEIHVLEAQAAQLTRLLRNTMEISMPTERMRAGVTALEDMDAGGMREKRAELVDRGTHEVNGQKGVATVQRLIRPWSERINVLRDAIADAALQRVVARQHARVHWLWVVTLASAAVVAATLASLALLRWRVVGPLARLGVAITRIASGDRATPVTMRSATREIAEMVTAVETLRHAALIADATETRQRMAARQRLLTLREALGIVLTVEAPARALERDVASLSEGIDTAIALVSTPETIVPPTLGTAADALRAGLADMRGSAAGLDATIAAARTAQTDDARPEAEIVAQILAMQHHVERRDAAVRGFIQPSLVALRDATSACGEAAGLRDLVRDQFQRIEATVATVSSMRAQVARASAIVRDLPLEDAPLAA